MEIDDLIEYENENTGLEFKAIQYRKENYFEFLKDVIAMANAAVENDKLIIVGVKKHLDGKFEIHPIEDLVDASTFQKLVIDNIEPDLHIDYSPHYYKGNQLIGVFRFIDCKDKPYMMKKDYPNRKKGESFIRKGTFTSALMRTDFNRIYEQKKREFEAKEKPFFKILFNGKEKLELNVIRNFKTYKELNKASYEYPEALDYIAHKYYTQQSVDSFNKWFDENPDKVKEYNKAIINFERAKKCKKNFIVTVINDGKAKANDINIEIELPSSVLGFDKKNSEGLDITDMPYPDGAPFHPLVRAQTSFESTRQKNSSSAPSAYQSTILPQLTPTNFNLFSSCKVSDLRKIEITIKNLLQTLNYNNDDLFIGIAPLHLGDFSAKAKIICEELPQAQIIEIPVSIYEVDE